MQETVEVGSQQESLHSASGVHLLVTFYGCASASLNDADALAELTRAAATATGALVLQLGSQRFEPQGITVFAVLAESHASLHTYPESAVVFWDCFTCGERCDPQASIAVLTAALKPVRLEKQIVLRG